MKSLFITLLASVLAFGNVAADAADYAGYTPGGAGAADGYGEAGIGARESFVTVRPGRNALRSDGVRLPAALSLASRPSRARLRPQGESIRFDALDSSGTASCQIRFRPALTTI